MLLPLEPLRIVHVDDYQSHLLLTKELLELQGYRVFITTEPRHALFLVDEHDPHLVILDYAMPSITGVELAKQIRSLKPDILILLYSGGGRTLENVDGFLPKGGGAVRLLAKVRSLLKAKEHGSGKQARICA